MYKFRKSSSTICPTVIDKTSSSFGVYYRKNIKQIQKENVNGEKIKEFEYDEIYLPNSFKFNIDDEDIYIAKIEEIIKTEKDKFNELKKLRQLENDNKAKDARYNQEFTITIQDKECVFDTSMTTQADLLTAFCVCSTGTTYDNWVTNNGISLNLTLEDVILISNTYKELSNVYDKWNDYKQKIEQAQTIEELNNLNLEY